MDYRSRSLLEEEDHVLTLTQKNINKGNSNKSSVNRPGDKNKSSSNKSNQNKVKQNAKEKSGSTQSMASPHPVGRPKSHKAEMNALYLSEESEALIIDVLESIHGKKFELQDIESYIDQGRKLKDHYWNERGRLILKCSYYGELRTKKVCSDKSGDTTSAEDHTKELYENMKAMDINKLNFYGFTERHCYEAYNYSKGSFDDALNLLYRSYFRTDYKIKTIETFHKETESVNAASDSLMNEEASFAVRRDEKEVMESIYGPAFTEKVLSTVWLLKFPIYEVFPSIFKKKTCTQAVDTTKEIPAKNRCRNFDKDGTCKYGSKCRFLHVPPVAKNKKEVSSNLYSIENAEYWLFMEVRFPKGCKYPLEAPFIFIKTANEKLPITLRLKLMNRLYNEALKSAMIGEPSIYTIALYLQNIETSGEPWDNEIFHAPPFNESILQTSALPPGQYCIGNDEAQTNKENIVGGPRHERGQTSHSNTNRSWNEVVQQNQRLIKRYLQKQREADSDYWKIFSKRQQLPAFQKRKEILNLLTQYQTIIISGDTGCGKSTQVPQYILEDWFEHESMNANEKGYDKTSGHIEIICTQPRKLSAIGVAERVATEQTDRLGQLIGYQVRLDNMISSATRLTFCTTGILLKRLISDPQLSMVTHLILDEVHERSEEIDFLLMILRDILKTRNDLKLVIMSATMNSESFSDYFHGAPIVNIKGNTFPIQEFFLEDILERCDYVIEMNSEFSRKLSKTETKELMEELHCADVKFRNEQQSSNILDELLNVAALYARYEEYSKQTCKTLYLMEPMKIDPALIESVLKYIVNGDHDWPTVGTILIFLPGFQEIYTVYDELDKSSIFGSRSGKYILVPLHSTLSSEEQVKVFRPAPAGQRKIVLSTNVAETSITIDDCVFVIDCGLKKENHFDTNCNMESLDLVWISKPNSQQRRGRAGRVMPGICIYLYTRHRYGKFLAQPIPEIHRVALEHLLLRIKKLEYFVKQNAEEVLGRCIEPPAKDRIDDAIKRLNDIGALYPNQELTPLGHHLATLPVDVRIGKLMLYGSIFQCLDSTLTIAACLSNKSPFVSPFKDRLAANERHQKFATAKSDHLTFLNAYGQWLEVMKRSGSAGKQFAIENYLSMKTLKTISELKYQYLEHLVEIGFVPIDVPRRRPNALDNILNLTGPELNKNGRNSNLLISLLCAALLPNIVKILMPERTYVKLVGGTVPQPLAAKQLRFQTRRDGFVAIHPSSVITQETSFSSSFIVFQEKVKTSRIFIRECSLVPVMSLVLFSGGIDLRIELHDGDFLFLLEDCWVVIKAQSQQVAELMKHLRLELFKLLENKIRDPGLNLLYHPNSRKIINLIIHLIT